MGHVVAAAATHRGRVLLVASCPVGSCSEHSLLPSLLLLSLLPVHLPNPMLGPMANHCRSW